MKKVNCFSAAVLLIALGFHSPAKAAPPSIPSLYNLIGTPPNVIDTETDLVEFGFTFSIQPGYQATFDKLGFWVNSAASPANSRATISLYEQTGSVVLPPPLQAQLINQLIGTNVIGATCSISNSFCYANFSNSITLVSGKSYLLTTRYNDFSNNNTYYAFGLSAPSEVAFVNNIVYGDAYFDPNSSTTPGDNYGYFGPNLGGLQVTAVGPTPGTGVPAPLPLLGASAALFHSRRIKSRIRKSA
jgi:hypothetical protein